MKTAISFGSSVSAIMAEAVRTLGLLHENFTEYEILKWVSSVEAEDIYQNNLGFLERTGTVQFWVLGDRRKLVTVKVRIVRLYVSEGVEVWIALSSTVAAKNENGELFCRSYVFEWTAGEKTSLGTSLNATWRYTKNAMSANYPYSYINQRG